MERESIQKKWTWLDRTEYPFNPNFLNLPMGHMHYVDEGQGEPIVFVHRNPFWSFEFRNQIKPELCIRVIIGIAENGDLGKNSVHPSPSFSR